MNPTALLHHPAAFDLPLNSLGQDRSYSNLNAFSTNDYAYSHRRTPNSLTNPGLGTTLPNSSLEYNTQPPLTDGPCHPVLLSPPESLSGSISATGLSTSSFAHATLPKPFASNASAPDPFAGASGAVLSSNWSDHAMTSLDRSRITNFPPLTPPVTYPSTVNGISGLGALLTRPNMDRTFPYAPGGGLTSGYSMGQGQNPFSYRNGPYPSYSHHDHAYAHTIPMPHPEPAKPEGPPFGKTVVLHQVVSHMNQELEPEISACIQKGFFQVEGKWTCYRRNYFTVACSFLFKPPHQDHRFYLSIHNRLCEIRNFAVSISAKTAVMNNQESEQRGLVQHTPKRDKATERVPEKHLVSPAATHPLHSNVPMTSLTGLIPGAQNSMMGAYSNLDAHGHQSPPPSYTFERIQFQKATANNGKRRAQQQYFKVVVELSAYLEHPVDGEHWVLIATKESESMVVRGRSPGHYKDSNHRRDSQTSMDPDRGTGAGSDGSSASYGYHGSHSSHLDWNSRGQHYHRSGGGYRACGVSEASPVSVASSTTLTESPTETEITMSDADALKSPEVCFEQPTLTMSESTDDSLFGLSRTFSNRKRPFEEDSADEGSPYHCSPPFGDSFSSNPFELSGLTQSKALFASS